MAAGQDQQAEHQTDWREQQPQKTIGRALARRIIRHPVVIAGPLALVALVAVGIVMATGVLSPKAQQASGVEVLGVQTSAAPAMATQSMEAMRTLNAQAFWASMDDEMRTSLQAQGVQGPDGVESMFAQIRATGSLIRSYRFIARYDTITGETVSFFVARRLAPDGQEADVPFLITTNQRGQVTKLE